MRTTILFINVRRAACRSVSVAADRANRGSIGGIGVFRTSKNRCLALRITFWAKKKNSELLSGPGYYCINDEQTWIAGLEAMIP